MVVAAPLARRGETTACPSLKPQGRGTLADYLPLSLGQLLGWDRSETRIDPEMLG